MLKSNPKLCKLKQQDRLYQMPVPIIGLTGGIASGKSSVSALLRKSGIQIIDADQLVKSIYLKNEVIQSIGLIAPKAVDRSQIDFKILRELFFSDPNIQSQVEKLIYAQMPLAFEQAFETKIKDKQDFIIYDVPLLFEKNLAPLVDHKVCVWCPRETQIQRLMARDSINRALALKMLDRQWDIDKKKSECDEVIDNSKGKTELESSVTNFISNLLSN